MKGQSNRTQIDGIWYYFHYKTKKWLKVTNHNNNSHDADTVKIANLAKERDGAGNAGSLPQGLAQLAQGKDQNVVSLQRELYLQRIKEAKELFRQNMS